MTAGLRARLVQGMQDLMEEAAALVAILEAAPEDATEGDALHEISAMQIQLAALVAEVAESMTSGWKGGDGQGERLS